MAADLIMSCEPSDSKIVKRGDTATGELYEIEAKFCKKNEKCVAKN
jgi:hypothetical protein